MAERSSAAGKDTVSATPSEAPSPSEVLAIQAEAAAPQVQPVVLAALSPSAEPAPHSLLRPSGGGSCHRSCRRPWTRACAARVLDNHTAHLIILLAVVLDIALLVGEILLSAVCPPAETPAQAATVAGWEAGLSWASRGIVIALLLHNLVLAACEGPCAYVHQPLHVADTVILVAALALELALKSDESEGGLVAVLLCWRLVRLVHGLVSAGEAEHSDVEAVRSEAARLSRLVEDLTARLATAQRAGDKLGAGDKALAVLPTA